MVNNSILPVWWGPGMQDQYLARELQDGNQAAAVALG